jgi:hypothetical protein
MGGIGAKVHQHLMDLRGVSFNRPQILFHILSNLNGSRQGSSQKFQTLFNERFDVERLPFLSCLAAESQDLLHQISGPMGRLDRLLQIVFGPGILRDIKIGEFRISQYGRQDIVEIMGNPPG